MKIKSLILGSAAGLVAMGGAQAADLPLKAKAVEYVKVCSLYGAGFWYIPGTDTCIKLGGYLRVDMGVDTNAVFTGDTNGPGAANNRFSSGYTWRSRQDLTLDTRTATEYGVVRTFMDVTFTWTGDNYAGNGVAPGSTIYSALGGGTTIAAGSAPNNATSGAVAGGTLGVYYAFIQFAGFTIGKAVSQFSAPFVNYPGNNYDSLVGGGGTVTGVNQFTYTAQFGNGVSASIGAQDGVQYYQAGVNNIGAGGAFGTSDYGNSSSPDFLATVTVDQAWGTFKASGAVHSNHAAYYGATEITGHPDDKFGYAGQAALALKNLPTGPGDTLNIQGVYTYGATRYNIQDLAAQAGANTIYNTRGHSVGTYQSIGFGFAPDAVFGPGGQLQLVETYGGRAGFTHNWDAYWNTSIYGAYAHVRYTDTAKTLICGVGGVGGSFRAAFAPVGGAAAVTTCNPDYNIAQAGIITRWTPVKNLTFSGEFVYSHLDQKNAGTVTTGGAAIGKPTLLYQLRDQDTIQVLLRAQRNF